MNRFFCFLFLMISGCSLFAQNTDSYKITNIALTSSDTTKVFRTSDYQTHSRFRQAILPISLIAGGVIIESLPAHSFLGKENIQQYTNDHLNGFRTSADNYLQFAPVAAILGMELAGVKGRNDLINQWSIMAKSELLMTAIVFSMKYMIHDTRPDGSTDNTMPSGHTAQAFVSATLLDMEYRDTSPWISVSGYLCAVSTGILRVVNNCHWASDVFIGAGIGIASVRLVYLTHRYRWGKKPAGVIIPMVLKNGGGVSFAMKF